MTQGFAVSQIYELLFKIFQLVFWYISFYFSST